jgi:hypothetical protein
MGSCTGRFSELPAEGSTSSPGLELAETWNTADCPRTEENNASVRNVLSVFFILLLADKDLHGRSDFFSPPCQSDSFLSVNHFFIWFLDDIHKITLGQNFPNEIR